MPGKAAVSDSKQDQTLIEGFNEQVLSKVPHREGNSEIVVNPTPLIDLTRDLIDCARSEFALDLSRPNIRVLGKLDSAIYGGSIKVRPAVEIIRNALASGKLHSGQTVFEATSGNFGLALGMLHGLGIDVITLVSRKLQDGVTDELASSGVKRIDLDVDICPAPGLQMDQNTLVAKTAATNLRLQLGEQGLDISKFDGARLQIEKLLARQDVIGLAKYLATVYDGYCPEQYDNPLNVQVHEIVTGPEIDQQLTKQYGESLSDFKIVSAFGTGGTSTGLARFVQTKYDKRNIHVVFPLSNQDVAGIRTKDKAMGLKFYQPSSYGGQHEVDFAPSKKVLRFFVSRGYDIGESSGLALYAALQMINYGAGEKYVIILADGIGKYANNLEESLAQVPKYEISQDEARKSPDEYGIVLWTHAAFTPRDEGIKLISSALDQGTDKIRVARAGDVQELIATENVPENLQRLIPENQKLLVVCMVGATSLRVAEVLGTKGVRAASVTGGIMNLPGASERSPAELVQMATE